MRFLLAGPSISLTKDLPDWQTLDLSRADQWFRSTLAGWLNSEADRLAAEVGFDDKVERWQRAKDIRIIANAIQNNGASGGAIGGMVWRLELEKPEAETETGEAAA
jgi:hypothetical protein